MLLGQVGFFNQVRVDGCCVFRLCVAIDGAHLVFPVQLFPGKGIEVGPIALSCTSSLFSYASPAVVFLLPVLFYRVLHVPEPVRPRCVVVVHMPRLSAELTTFACWASHDSVFVVNWGDRLTFRQRIVTGFIIFLAGIIAAGSVALIMMYGNANQAVAAAEADLAAEMKKVTALEAVITKKDETIAAQAETLDSYADFQSIIALQARSDALEADIDALLAQPSRANAPASLKQMPDEVEWLDDVVSALSARRDKLAAQKAAVEAWPPAPARVRPD